jgi:hypothetical protein
MTKCKVCGRRLTVPLSVSRGIGPVCWSRLTRANNTNPKCPKCGSIEVYDRAEFVYLGHGEVDCVDWDPVCAKCGHPLGDDWYSENIGFGDRQPPIYQSHGESQEHLPGVKWRESGRVNATASTKRR